MTTNRRRDTAAGDGDPVVAALYAVDAATPPPPLQAGLAARVLTRGRRRRQRRRLAGGAALAIVLVASAIAVLGPVRKAGRPPVTVATTTKAEPPYAPDPTRLAAELSRASLEADMQTAVVRRLRTAERRRMVYARLDRSLAAAGSAQIDPVAAQREQAALTLVHHADRLKSRVERPADALATYQRAVELFPDTPSAHVARRRIENLQSQQKP